MTVLWRPFCWDRFPCPAEFYLVLALGILAYCGSIGFETGPLPVSQGALWDENNDGVYANDGVVWHPHWVVLQEDSRVKGGLSVKQFKKADNTVVLPPTNPGMPMFMDSPGYPVKAHDHTITVVVPDYRINNRSDFNYDGVTAYMRVNTSDPELPMLGVYDVYSVASGDLTLPYKVK